MSDSEERDLLDEQQARARAWFESRDIDRETAYGKASAGPQRNTPISLLSGYYEPDELSSAAQINSLLDILDMKIDALNGRVGDEHLDQLRRRRSALEDVLNSPVTEYEHEHLTWGDIALAFED